MNIFFALLLIFAAGIINGSFALPTKYMPKWKFENIWLQFAIWTFAILPWSLMFILEPKVLNIYAATPHSLLWIILGGGLIFGIGQICFAFALNIIGLGLGFVINIGLGIGLGFLLPLAIQHPQQILTPFGFVTLCGTVLAVCGLIVSNHAGMLRDREKCKLAKTAQIPPQNSNKHTLGVLLATIAGVASAGQNFVFSLTYNMQQIAANMGANQFAAANILWPGFLICAFIPYVLYTLYLHNKNKSFVCYKKKGTGKYHIFAIIMGLFWYGSLVFYGKASQLIGSLGPLVGWPMFMVLIILTSSFWGWQHKEWEESGDKAKKVMRNGLLLLVLAIIVLGYGSSVHLP